MIDHAVTRLDGRQVVDIKRTRQVSNIRRTLVSNKIVDHSDVGAAPTTSSFST